MAGVIRNVLLSSAKLVTRNILPCQSHNTPGIVRHISISSQRWNSLTKICSLRTMRATGVAKLGNCGVHTEVDQDISKMLDKEIKFEESSSKATAGLPTIQGFEVTAEGALVTLTRKQENEKVKVSFNVNGTTDVASEESEQMISRPQFTVEIDKGSGNILGMECAFSVPDNIEDESQPQDADSIVDQFEIHEVTIHQGDWSENTYAVSADSLDRELYELLMDMLDERGIDDDFVSALVEFSTAYEHGKYVDFLKNFKGFIEKV